MTEKTDITALLGSRICHDLISPIGAIGNGVELLMLEGANRSPELQLISDSVAHANAKIRFFRLAYGIAGSEQQMGRAEVISILQDLNRGGRLLIDWQSPIDLPRREVRLAFLALQCIETAMPHGGSVTIELAERRLSLLASSSRLRLDADLWEMLSNPQAGYELAPAQVHFALLRDELGRQHRRLMIETDETNIRLSV